MTNQCKHGLPTFSYCQKCCREITAIRNLDKQADFIRAAHSMVLQHSIHETMLPAVEYVAGDFHNIPEPLLRALWIGINAKQRDIEIETWMAACQDDDDFGEMRELFL